MIYPCTDESACARRAQPPCPSDWRRSRAQFAGAAIVSPLIERDITWLKTVIGGDAIVDRYNRHTLGHHIHLKFGGGGGKD
jgi:hypothetical protein